MWLTVALCAAALVLAGCSAPPEPKPQEPRIRVGDTLVSHNLLRHVKPIYPKEARRRGIGGVVAFKARIGTDGTVKNLELMKGHPLLVPAAREAVLQWRYKPVQLGGQPVEVITQIEVNFYREPERPPTRPERP